MELGKRIVAICMSILLATQVDPLAAQAYAEALGDAAAQNTTNQTAGGNSDNADSDSASQEGSESGTEEETPADAMDADALQSASDAVDAEGQSTEVASVETASSEVSEQAIEDEIAAQAASIDYSDVGALEQALETSGATNVVVEGNAIKSLTIPDGKSLVVLSHANPGLYQNAAITSTLSGDFNLTSNDGDSSEKKFQGLGSADVPFCGTLNQGQNYTYALDRALFAGVKVNSDVSFNVCFKGAAQDATSNLFADYVEGPDSGDAAQLTVSATLASDDNKDNAQINVPLLGIVNKAVSLNATFKTSNGNFNKNTAISVDENAGLIARTVAGNGNLTLQSISGFEPNSGTSTATTSVTSNSSNAGLLVGELESGSKFETCGLGSASGTGFVGIIPEGTVKATSGAAGGLVGKVDEGASIKITGNEVDLSKMSIAGKYSGGFAGLANKIALNDDFFTGKLKLPKTVGDSNTQYAGGFIGKASFNSDYSLFDSNKLVFPETITLSGKSGSGHDDGAGAVFGQLDLCSNVKISNREDIKSGLAEGSSSINYGGVVGRVRPYEDSSSGPAFALTLSSVTAKSGSGDKAWYYGGLIGWVGKGNVGINKTALVVRGATAEVNYGAPSRSFGGAVGCIDGSAAIDLGTFTLKTGATTVSCSWSDTSFAGGAFGELWRGSVVRFSGTTDLSQAQFADSAKVGQLVGANAKGIAFAVGNGQDGSGNGGVGSGWTLNRGEAVGIDDIANHDEVIRLTENNGLSGLLTIGDDYKLAIENPKTVSDGKYEIMDIKDFARLAISYQTAGTFNGVSNYGSINQIEFKNNINLTGTGLQGLVRDTAAPKWADATPTYTGSVNGGGCTVTLAIGEPYGKRKGENISLDDPSEGNGKIYRHDRLGLFAAMTGNVSNLKVNGTIAFCAKTQVNAGALAGRLADNAATTLTRVESQVKVTCSSNGFNACAGGFFGLVEEKAQSLTFESLSDGSANKASLETSVTTQADRVVVGGAVGLVDGDGAFEITVKTDGLKIGGQYTAGALADNKTLPVGGFVGMILGSGKKKTVNLSGLTIDGFKLKSPSTDSVGGMLGYLWTNTDVVFNENGVRVQDSSLGATQSSGTKTNKIKRAGGLVYCASGKWQVNDKGIDLDGYTIDNVSDELGLLVGRGGANKERVLEADYRTEGLYLEVTAPWATACKLNQEICKCSPSNYDEWVGSVTDTTGDSGSNINDILKSGYNGVVSLRTNGDFVTMDGTSRNTYVNRTRCGETRQTNPNTRYYYNLDKIKSEVQKDSGNNKSETINTAQELMLWSLIKYAAPTLTSHFCVDGTDCVADSAAMGKITGVLDMQGYSYYPVDVNANLSIQYAQITFHNDKIEQSESASPSNKVTSDGTQHMAMHAGLIRDFTAVNNQSGNPHTLKVTNVTLSGSVGMMSVGRGDGTYKNNASSGALICGDAYGSQTESGDRNTCAISIDGLTLDGVSIYDYANRNQGYAPLVVNAMGSYVNLSVANVTLGTKQTKGTQVATSLMGNLGGEYETQITATFGGNIAIPSKNQGDSSDAIFSKASLLNSFAYRTDALGMGSAIYNFYKDEASKGKATFGAEIDRAANTEYRGKQLWYFDEEDFGEDGGLVVEPIASAKANIESPAFGDYLPYVYVSKNTGGKACNHEIKVNQRLEDLTTGCGTYGDPYVVATESKLVALTTYVNENNPTGGWKITIARNQGDECKRRAAKGTETPDTSNEVTYIYSDNDRKWHEKGGNGELANDTMHRYVAGCYIDIQTTSADGNETPTLTVHTSRFVGLGSVDSPFRGVLTSTNGTKLEINHDDGAGSFSGLIKYSYGCVVKNLPIEYTGEQNTVNYASKDPKHAAPGSFFGGVFGNILGGDNIIDGVIVTAPSKDNKKFSAAAGGNALELVPIGGYVGTITGGGVVFRGSMGASWHDGSKTNYYDNPVVGRVLDGYAFIEGDDCNVGDNTVSGKVCNYKVNKLDSSKTGTAAAISTGDLHNSRTNGGSDQLATTTTLSSSQGLLVLSAIINSGAAAGPVDRSMIDDWMKYTGYFSGTNAYSGTAVSEDGGYQFGNGDYGKTRNASYNSIGRPGDSDFGTSVVDDTHVPGITSSSYPHDFTKDDWSKVNAPYLVSRYCANKKTMYICGAGYSSIDLQFSAQSYDMRDYGNGYRGLSAVYYTNALMDSTRSGKTYSRDRGIPWVAHIAGVADGSTLKADLHVKEYSNDDFNVVGAGALFSYAMFTEYNVSETTTKYKGNYIENLTIADSNIAHEGGKVDSSSKTNSNYGVGGIAGVVAAENDMNNNKIKLSNVKVESNANNRTTITGPATAGGFFGNSGIFKRVDTKGTSTEASEVAPITSGSAQNTANVAFEFEDCSYSGLDLTGGYHTGGFVGLINSSVGSLSNVVSVDGGGFLGSTSTVLTTSTSSTGAMGGILGCAKAPVVISAKEGKVAQVDNVQLTTSAAINAAGGLVGQANSATSISRTVVNGDEAKKTDIGSTRRSGNYNDARYAGGLVGLASVAVTISEVEVSNIKLVSSEGNGGAVGKVNANANVVADNFEANCIEIAGSCSGGFSGAVDGDKTTISVSNSSFKNISLSNKRTNGGWSTGNQSGAVTGDARGTFKLNNILIDACSFGDKPHQGILAGNASKDSLKGFYVAGLEVRGEVDSYPSRCFSVGTKNDSTIEVDTQAINKKSFASFANYDGTAAESGNDHPLFGNPAQAEPWVTTSPSSNTKVSGSYLYGDGPNLSVAPRIAKGEFTENRNAYSYLNTGGQDATSGAWTTDKTFENASYASTYGNNNTLPKDMDDFGVLQISGGDTGVVESYLNTITNGAFSDAGRRNSGSNVFMIASAKKYKLVGATKDVDGGLIGGQFEQVEEIPNVTVASDGKSFNVSPTEYDNGEDTFTLITVTFSADGNAKASSPTKTHTVMVPVIVRRQLETTVTATLDHGTNFTEDAYKSRGDYVRLLESFGNSSTALITFQYNKALGQSYEYGWDSYLAAGGSMKDVDKSITFNSNGKDLPSGTKFTLIDKDNGDHTYTYELSAPSSSVKLSEFMNTQSADGQYRSKWMSELMGVSAGRNDASGAWVSCSEDQATAKAKDGNGDWGFYRPYSATDAGQWRFDLKCAKDNQGKETTPSENFYLVIYIPQGASMSLGNINGYMGASVSCSGVKFGDIKYALRPGGSKTTDRHKNTASTYNFVSAYGQELKDDAISSGYETGLRSGYYKQPDTPIDSGAGRVLHMDVLDKITVAKDQLYTSNDPLYYKLDASLSTYKDGNTTGSAFPTGVEGNLDSMRSPSRVTIERIGRTMVPNGRNLGKRLRSRRKAGQAMVRRRVSFANKIWQSCVRKL